MQTMDGTPQLVSEIAEAEVPHRPRLSAAAADRNQQATGGG
jgi:hypothetical protein